MDSIQVARWQGKYQSLSPPLRWILVSVYTTQLPKKFFFFFQYTKKWLEIELSMHDFGTEGNITCYSYQNLPISTLWKHLSIVWYKLIIVIFHELFMKKTLNKNSCLSVLWCEQGHTKPWGSSSWELRGKGEKKEHQSYDKMILDLGGSGG